MKNERPTKETILRLNKWEVLAKVTPQKSSRTLANFLGENNF